MLADTLIIITALCFGIYFFKQSAGTLNPGKLNLISVTFYLYIVQTFLGSVLIKWGFDRHYTLDKLVNRTDSINTAFYAAMAGMVIWPFFMYLFQRLFRFSAANEYAAYLKKPVYTRHEKQVFWYILLAGSVCLGLLAIYLIKIGYIPLIRLFTQPEGFNYAVERIRINHIVLIKADVRNIMILLAIPLLSYVTFAFALSTKSPRWVVLAVLFFIAALVTKTYNFEKSPLVFHLMVYVLICIYHFGGLRALWVLLFGGVGVGILLAAYLLVAGVSAHDLYNGIFGRTVFTPVGVFAFNFDMFPDIYGFLMGRSIAPTLLKLFGIDPTLQLRSARLLMEFYGSQSVYEGTAGVLNTVFMGEAYANFGWVGLGFSLVWIGFVISGLFTLMTRVRKSPVTIALTAYLGVSIATTTQGGFFDFIYNALWMVAIGGLLCCEYLPDVMQYIQHRLRKHAREGKS